ncbi:MAG: UDP-glucose 4-epimerase GalE [Clostridia bacterium]|nr:UDP-glucose 4-epimerase GalE [Clostridia bacterium]
MAVLVTGGAGYIGSHTVRRLTEAGEKVVALDNLATGHVSAVTQVPLIREDILHTDRIEQILKGYGIESVVHFAAFSQVGESMRNPMKYYRNNVEGTLSLLRAMVNAGVDKIVFSSTAALYGNAAADRPITEEDPIQPTSVYGRTKQMIETALRDFDMVYHLRSVCLRYFNASGAQEDGTLGEDHRPESHLIPNALFTALGQRDRFTLFGTDYPTRDGTCIRDYIHVQDLAEAHLLALRALRDGLPTDSMNLGVGEGYSNREILSMVEKVTGKSLRVEEADRRAGDPPVLVASSAKARRLLGWEPVHSSLENIVGSAYRWHLNHPEGYAD